MLFFVSVMTVGDLYLYRVGIGAVNLAFCPLALILNFILIFNILIRRRLRIVRHALIGNVAFTNLTIVIFGQMPFACNFLNLVLIPFEVVRPLGHIFISVSFFAVGIAALERYIAFYYPYSYLRCTSPRNLAVLISITWVVPIVIGALVYVPGVDRLKIQILTSSITLIVVILTIFAHIRFLITVRRVTRQIRASEDRFVQNGGQQIRDTARGTRCTMIFFVMLVLCDVPYCILGFLIILSKDQKLDGILSIIFTLTYMPAIFVPILAFWVTKDLRDAVCRCLCSRCSRAEVQ